MTSLRLRLSLLGCAVLALAVPAGAQAQGCAYADQIPNSSNIAQLRGATLCLLNQERAKNGLGAVAYNETLETSSQVASDDMVARRYFSHTPPEGTSLQEKLAAYIAGTSVWNIGENLAWGDGSMSTPAATVVAWMNSPGHRANVLNGEFKEIGVGITPGTPNGSAGGGTYATHYGTRSGGGGGAADDLEVSTEGNIDELLDEPRRTTPKKRKARKSSARRCVMVKRKGKKAKRVCGVLVKKSAKKSASRRTTRR
jgi:uncharacterized protein YkwD